MIEISAKNENVTGFDLTVHMEGKAVLLIDECVAIFDNIYRHAPEVFEKALLLSQYTEDHT